MDSKNTNKTIKSIKKAPKKGIIYLSSIPPYINVSKIREIFGQFGTVGRVYLQLDDRDINPTENKKRKFAQKFTEGWIEYERKSIAKQVAIHLNNTQVSTRKKSKLYDYIWNIKYLSNFKWTYLHERLAYEKAARRQKLRAEIQLAKKKTNYFTANLDKRKQKTFVATNSETTGKTVKIINESTTDRKEFLKSLFT